MMRRLLSARLLATGSPSGKEKMRSKNSAAEYTAVEVYTILASASASAISEIRVEGASRFLNSFTSRRSRMGLGASK